MTKKEFVNKTAKSLGLSKRQTEYYVSFILDLLILEAERTGKVKIDSHVFYKRTTAARKWKDMLFDVERSTPAIQLVSYRNTRRFKRKNALESFK